MEVRCVQESFNRGLSSIMPDYGPDVNDFNPSWMEDGGGLSGGSESDPQSDYEQSYLIGKGTVSAAEWETQTTSRQNQTPPDSPPNACIPSSPPDSGTVVWGAIDGECQWIDTTTCD